MGCKTSDNFQRQTSEGHAVTRVESAVLNVFGSRDLVFRPDFRTKLYTCSYTGPVLLISKMLEFWLIFYHIWAAMQENRSSGFPTRSDTNRPVQLQNMARSLKFRIRKKGNCTIPLAKTKALTAQVICIFVFVWAKIWFSHDMAHIHVFCLFFRRRRTRKSSRSPKFHGHDCQILLHYLNSIMHFLSKSDTELYKLN